MLTDEEIFELEELYHIEEVENSREDLFEFTKKTFPSLDETPFHQTYYKILDMFADGVIKRLIVTIPPQHGKSEGSTRRLPAYMLGQNPNLRIAVGSYSSTFARKFNRDVQRIIDTPIYQEIFKETKLNDPALARLEGQFLRNSEEFEIVGKKGTLKAVGRGGSLTGNPVDVMIMDDLYKSSEEGNSPVIREAVWDWYSSVVTKRLHNDSQQLVVFTRWHQDDLVGMLEQKDTVIEVESIDEILDLPDDFDGWIKINFEAIKESEPTELDPRERGEVLYAKKHSYRKLKKERDQDEDTFNCMNQGNPVSQKGLLYKPFKTYLEIPQTRLIKSYTDTADKGTDFLCSIHYAIPLNHQDDRRYIIDVVYSVEGMEVTEPLVAKSLKHSKVDEAMIESNNGGRGFARNVETELRAVGGRTEIDWYHQSDNKESRIHSNSASVNRRILFPEGWEQRWPTFHKDLKYYKKLFNANKQDGIPDVLTAIIEDDILNESGGVMW